MTTVELNARKLEIIGMLMDVTDEKILARMASLIGKRTPEIDRIPGLAYTHEERMEDIKAAENEIEAGLTIPHAEIKKMIAQWGRG